MRGMIRLTISGILLAGMGMAQTSAPDLNTIVSRMQTAMAGRNHDRAYSVTREYRLVPEDASKATRVVAEINTVSSGSKDYSITEGGGQAEKIVRKVLDHETESANQHTGMAMTSDNYNFAYLGTEANDGHTCYVVQLNAKHDGKDMLNGRLWIDTDSYLVRQFSGSPAKSPSWWIKDLQVTLHYKDVDGLWLQDSTQAVAQVRIVGRHVLTSRALNVRTDMALASKTAPQKATQQRRRRLDPSLVGAGVFQHR